jgi:hypothetical protein
MDFVASEPHFSVIELQGSLDVAGRRTTAEAIEEFLESAPKGWALSLARAVREVRSMIPHCELTDHELADLVAIEAVARGFSVLLFDTAAPENRGGALGEDRLPPSRPDKKVIAFVPELQRAALQITGNRKAAEDLVKRVVKFAISMIDQRPRHLSAEDWLLGLIRQCGSSWRWHH